MSRKRIFEIIEVAEEDDRLSAVYDSCMLLCILLSLIPLVFKETTPFLNGLDKACVVIFIADYLLRWSTADYKFNSASPLSFARYPFSFMAIVDLVSILPSLTVLNSGFKVLRVLRMFRALRVFRVLKALRYSRSLRIIANVLRRSKESLMAVGTLAVGYILISSLIIFNAEPDSFHNFFEAVYWSTVLLTTVGFGDITPVTTIGRTIAIFSSLFGIAIVALPSGIITAGYMKELEEQRAEEEKERAAHPERSDAVPRYLNRFRLRPLNGGRHEKTNTDKEDL